MFFIFFLLWVSTVQAQEFSNNVSSHFQDTRVHGALIVGREEAYVTASTTITASSPIGSTVLYVENTKGFEDGKFIEIYSPDRKTVDGFDIEKVVNATTLTIKPHKPLTFSLVYGSIIHQRYPIDPNGTLHLGRRISLNQWGAFQRFIINGREVRLELLDTGKKVKWRFIEIK